MSTPTASARSDFPGLMRRVASVSPLLRVRFATSHPKDISDRLLEVMAEMPNICRAIHLPAQSGASSMLARMNRKYTREWYLDRVAAIRRYLPDCAVTTDLIAGFSGETEEEHAATLSLMREVGYEFAYMFKYSERPGTYAHKHLPDDVPEEVKSARLAGDHCPAERTEPREQPARRGARIRSAGRGNVQARREPAFGPYLAEQGRGIRPRRPRRRRLCAGPHYGLHSRDAFRRRNFRRIKLRYVKCDLTNLSWRMRSSTDSTI